MFKNYKFVEHSKKLEESDNNLKIEQIVNSTSDFIERILEKVKKYKVITKTEQDNEVIEIPFEEFKHSLIQKLEREEEKCIICANPLLTKHAIDCGHEFCSKCTKKWKNINDNCPICRRSIIILS
jgi:hypothetical protein